MPVHILLDCGAVLGYNKKENIKNNMTDKQYSLQYSLALQSNENNKDVKYPIVLEVIGNPQTITKHMVFQVVSILSHHILGGNATQEEKNDFINTLIDEINSLKVEKISNI